MSWLLTLQDDNGGFKFVSNAFQIDPAPSNIVHLTCFHPSHIIAIPLLLLFFLAFSFANPPLTGLFEEGADLKWNFFHFVLEQL